MTDERSRKAVEVLEKCADWPEDDPDWHSAGDAADEARIEIERSSSLHVGPCHKAESCASWAAYYINFTIRPEWTAGEAATARVWDKVQQGIDHRIAKLEEWTIQCGFLRDIFGNPFRPVAIDASWLTPSVVNLARSIYDDRAYYRMSELAGTLKEAGCHDGEILTHCRQAREHVLGCWVVALLLGKE